MKKTSNESLSFFLCVGEGKANNEIGPQRIPLLEECKIMNLLIPYKPYKQCGGITIGMSMAVTYAVCNWTRKSLAKNEMKKKYRVKLVALFFHISKYNFFPHAANHNNNSTSRLQWMKKRPFSKKAILQQWLFVTDGANPCGLTDKKRPFFLYPGKKIFYGFAVFRVQKGKIKSFTSFLSAVPKKERTCIGKERKG